VAKLVGLQWLEAKKYFYSITKIKYMEYNRDTGGSEYDRDTGGIIDGGTAMSLLKMGITQSLCIG